MTIIAATDFSPVASNALQTAVQLARKLNESVVLVRVLQPTVEVHPELRVPESTAFDAALREANEAEMRKAVSAVGQEGVAITGRTLVGSPAQVLAALAQELGARLIVMGLRARGRVARLVMGSVAERTVLSAPCPVLVVPENAAPFAEWAAGRPLRALVGLDLDSASPAVLEQIGKLREAGPCDATFVHTYWPPAEYDRLGQVQAEGLSSNPYKADPQIVAVLEREIRARVTLPEGPGSNTLRIDSAWGPIGDALALDARAGQADLLVVGTQQPHGWDRVKHGSAAVGTLRASRTAVLCVPAKPAPQPEAKTPSIPIIKTILCATDLSALGNAAVAHAYSLLRGTGGVVELCHVHQKVMPPVPVYDLHEESLPPAERQRLEARLLALVPAEAADLGISTRVTVVDGGEPAAGINQAARRLGADAVVLASHGRTGIVRSVLGSVAEAVLRGSERPVFVVRAGHP